MRPNIQDIAEATGVSKGTVSRVINGHPTVAASTRQRVLDAMQQLGFQPDPAARQLSWRTGRTLGLSVEAGDPLLAPYQVLFRRALERETGALGLELIETGHDLRTLTRLPSAVLLMHLHDDDSRPAHLQQHHVPAAVVGHHPELAWVAPDDRGGAQLAARALTDLGHRRLMFLGHGDSQVAQDRLEGFSSEAARVGATVRTVRAAFSVLDGYRAIMRAGPPAPDVTAIFAACDELAAGATVALMDLGVRVPHDVSVIGFDGLPELPQLGCRIPRLTTIQQDIDRVATEALGLVQDALAGRPPRGVFVPVRFLEGETTAPPGGSS